MTARERGLVVIAPNLGSAILRPEVEEAVREAGEALAKHFPRSGADKDELPNTIDED